jgi:hypothetical protein
VAEPIAAFRGLVRKQLLQLLVTGMFEIVSGDPVVYTSRLPHAYYEQHFSKQPEADECVGRRGDRRAPASAAA